MNKFIKSVLIVVCVVALIISAGKITNIIYPTKYNEAVSSYSAEYGLPSCFVYAVIKAESNFEPEAQSPKNAVGLMQITEPTGEWISGMLELPSFRTDMLKEPERNIQMGCFYLSYLLNMYNGNKKCALAAYNAGLTKVNSWLLNETYSKNGTDLDVIPFPETEQYVNQVLKNERIYQFLYKNECSSAAAE